MLDIKKLKYSGLYIKDKQGSDVLLQADVMTLSNKRCVERFRSDGVDTTQQICAGEKGGSKDTCQVDLFNILYIFRFCFFWYVYFS